MTELTMKPKYIAVDQIKCSGCRLCEMVCSDHHFGVFNSNLSAIHVDRSYGGSGNWILTHTCRQCVNAWCMNVCPTHSISRNNLTGAVIVNKETCIGCGSCERACPFEMIKVNPQEKKSFKCDLCGGEPECVLHCPNQALKVAKIAIRTENVEVVKL